MKVAVIPARGGSKRIPRKNIREFCGKPIIAYSIECAKQSGLFDRIIVSTDDDEVSQIARNFGAEVPFRRPAALSDDYTGTTKVVAHAIDWLQSGDSNVSEVCCIYATAPFVDPGDIQQALAVLLSGGWQYVFPATTFSSTVFRSFKKNAEDGLEMIFPEHFDERSQDLDEVLHDAGQFYWGRSEAWLSGARIFDNKSTVVRIPRWRVQDIDTEADWLRAEFMAAYLGIASRTGSLNTG